MRSVIKKNIAAGIIGPLMLFPSLVMAGVFMAIYEAESLSELYEAGNFSVLIDAVITSGIFALYGLIFAYPLTIFFGLPVAALLRKIGMFNLPVLLLVSLIPANIIFGVFEPTLAGWLFYSYASLAVALGCWYSYEWA
ncbi:MAG TPA: hypothetical protein VF433_09270 [Cellvibrio sp.]